MPLVRIARMCAHGPISVSEETFHECFQKWSLTLGTLISNTAEEEECLKVGCLASLQAGDP